MFSEMVNTICYFFTFGNGPHNLKIIYIFMNAQQIFMFKVSILITFL